MDIRMGSRSGRKAALEGVEDRIRQELVERQPGWEAKLSSKPCILESVEREVHAVFGQLADEVVAGLLAKVTGKKEFQERAKN